VEVTVAAMNETAEALGAFDTVAGTPSGLDVAGQSSSPYDLALIFRALISNPTTAAYLVTPTAQMPEVPGRSPGYQIQNQNPLLGSYPGNLGGKTGFTDAARHTFVTAAERNGRRLVVSVMATENVPLRAADQAALLLDWGFALPAGVEAVGELVAPGEVDAAPATADGTPSTSAPIAAAATAAAPPDEPSSPWVPAALAAGAVLLVAGTVIGRRRAVRPVPRSDGAAPAGVRRPPPRRPSGEGPAPGSSGGSPSTRP
jgi:D-alanyl-D-alanine carboxypeptidase (penicillin-binding protein 5/6)